MQKIVIAPDSFKGTMTSAEVCEITAKRVTESFPNVEILSVPIADGGEGTAECFLLAVGGERVTATVKSPYFEDMEASFAVINGGKTAVIESAVCVGLPLVENRKNPAVTTTYGVGQLIKVALERGVSEIIIALGGSCTNDGGCGCAAALGVEFFNEKEEVFIPVGGTLSQISSINMRNIESKLADVDVIIMCDVDNPLYGENGAAYVYAPQKGADETMVAQLDQELQAFSTSVKQFVGTDISSLKGAGAAGGMGGGLTAFLNGKLKSGIETILDAINFNSIINGADLIITGEGRIDSQTVNGKVVAGVARRGKSAGIPVVAVVGNIGDGAEQTYDIGVTAIMSINRASLPFESVQERCRDDLAKTIDDLMKILKIDFNKRT